MIQHLSGDKKESDLRLGKETSAAERTSFIPMKGRLTESRLDVDDVLGEYVHQNDSLGLGRWAVEFAMRELNDSLNDDLAGENTYTPYAKEQITATRESLENLNRRQRRRMHTIIAGQPTSPWLRERVGKRAFNRFSRRTVVDRLTEKNKGEYKINDDVFQNFLQWHNHNLVHKQREFNERVPELKKSYADKLKSAVQRGWIPMSVLSKLNRLESVDVHIDDGMRTAVKRVGGLAVSFAESEQHIVTLSPDELDDPSRTLSHEFTHILDGHESNHRLNKGKRYRQRRTHGLQRIFGGGRMSASLNEAVTEHFADSLEHGQLQVTNPNSKVRKEASYEDERYLLHVLCRSGNRKIDIRVFLAAFFEDNMQRRGGSAGEELLQSLRGAFPFTDIVQEIKSLPKDTDVKEYAQDVKKRARNHKLRRSLRRLIVTNK